MRVTRKRFVFFGAALAAMLLAAAYCSQEAGTLRAGFARRDITPREPVPMWGYASRHDKLSEGVIDPLHADVLVLQAGRLKLAVVALDLGRSPNERSLEVIRRRIRERTGIEHSIIAASHTHHGPVLELSGAPGKGRGKFDAALRYYRQLEDAVVDAAVEAERRLTPARLFAGSRGVEGRNRNRHTKLDPKPGDRDLAVLRLDGRDGNPIAAVVNFAAHPTMLPASTMKFSADYCGALKRTLEKATGAPVLFLQGAAGDQSVNDPGKLGPDGFGAALAGDALGVFRSIGAAEIRGASLAVREERFRFSSRTDFRSPLIRFVFERAFFPELVADYLDEYSEGIRPRLTVALLNREVAFVAASGEFFSAHSIRLKQRARLRQVFFAGYANGYHQYFPTIEAAAEGGYGADNKVSPVAIGAGEQMMDAALEWVYRMQGRLD
jgi:hypothetical protein